MSKALPNEQEGAPQINGGGLLVIQDPQGQSQISLRMGHGGGGSFSMSDPEGRGRIQLYADSPPGGANVQVLDEEGKIVGSVAPPQRKNAPEP